MLLKKNDFIKFVISNAYLFLLQVHVPIPKRNAIVITMTCQLKEVTKGFLLTKIIYQLLNSSLEMLAIVEKGAGILWDPSFARVKFGCTRAVLEKM